MTQVQFAQATGIAFSTYRRLERGAVAKPDLGRMAACARVLGCDVLDLLTDEQRRWMSASDPADGSNRNRRNAGANPGEGHIRGMGRAKSSLSATVGANRRGGTPRGDVTKREAAIITAADRGDFEPFLELVQSGTPPARRLLDGPGLDTACAAAVKLVRIDRTDSLERELAAAGVPAALSASILDALGELAAGDLAVALLSLVDAQEHAPLRRADVDGLKTHALALVENRVGQALGQHFDRELLAGAWLP